MKIKCSKCGYEDEGNFCSNCGARLIKNEMSLPPAQQEEKDYNDYLLELSSGNILIEIQGYSPVLLKKNETLHLSIDEVILHEPISVGRGVYGGPSIRIAKGLSVRFGGFKSSSSEEIQAIDKGTFVCTNKKIVYSGSKKSINIDLRKIISIEVFSDGIGIAVEGKNKKQYFSGLDNDTLTISVGNREYNKAFNGEIVKSLIEGLIKNIE